MGLQVFPENRNWRCRRDVQRQSILRSQLCVVTVWTVVHTVLTATSQSNGN